MRDIENGVGQATFRSAISASAVVEKWHPRGKALFPIWSNVRQGPNLAKTMRIGPRVAEGVTQNRQFWYVVSKECDNVSLRGHMKHFHARLGGV
jgi:hypothetical protein